VRLGGLLERAVATGAILGVQRRSIKVTTLCLGGAVPGRDAGTACQEQGTAGQQDKQIITRHGFQPSIEIAVIYHCFNQLSRESVLLRPESIFRHQ
jgi:hypothetical protein